VSVSQANRICAGRRETLVARSIQMNNVLEAEKREPCFLLISFITRFL
jgi:hypothetical protein